MIYRVSRFSLFLVPSTQSPSEHTQYNVLTFSRQYRKPTGQNSIFVIVYTTYKNYSWAVTNVQRQGYDVDHVVFPYVPHHMDNLIKSFSEILQYNKTPIYLTYSKDAMFCPSGTHTHTNIHTHRQIDRDILDRLIHRFIY